MSDDVLVKVEGVSKKFCRSLKRSLWYGVQDVASEMLGREGHHDELRKNEFWAVNDVSFELKRGECLGLIGPNGAGKSTLLKMLNGLVKPDKGRITMRGRVGALIELGAGFNPILTARENIYVNGSVLGFSKKEIDGKFDAIVDFAEIEEFIDTPVQNFSSGMKVRLGFAVAAQMEPDVLLIDEVLAVGDVGFRNKCYNSIYNLCANASVILVTHSMNHIERTCTSCILLDQGKLVSESACTHEVIQDYLGLFNREKAKATMAEGVSLLDISVNGKPAKEKQLQAHGDSFTLEFCGIFPPRANELEISLSFLTGGLELVANVNSKVDQFKVPNLGCAQRILVVVPTLELGTGYFHPSLTVRDAATNEILVWLWAFSDLKMSSDSYHPAMVQMHAKWQNVADSEVLAVPA